MAHDGRSRQVIQFPVGPLPSAIYVGVRKYPFPTAYVMEVFLPDPISGLIRMPAFCPPPESPENQIFQFTEDFLRHDWGMVTGPPPQYRVQLRDERLLR